MGGICRGAQCAHGEGIGPRRSPKPQVNTPRKQVGQGAELLGNHQRRMVGQHDAAGAHTNAVGAGGHVGNHQ